MKNVQYLTKFIKYIFQVLKSPIFANLSSCVQSNAMDTLPSEANRGLMKALITVGSACEDQAAKDAHWNKVLKPLCDRYLLTKYDIFRGVNTIVS